MDHHSNTRSRTHTSNNAPAPNDGWEYDCGFGTGITATQAPPPPPTSSRPHIYTAPNPQTQSDNQSSSSYQRAANYQMPTWGNFQPRSTGFAEPTNGPPNSHPANPWANSFTWHPPFVFPNQPPVDHSTPSPEESPPSPTMPPLVAESPISHASTDCSDEDDEYDYFSYEPRTLRTRQANNGKEYLAIPDVFHHVTLGGRLSQRHLMELGSVVKSYVFADRPDTDVYEKVSITRRDPVVGTTRTFKIIPYRWCDFGRMAQSCLQFAMDHPEYLAR